MKTVINVVVAFLFYLFLANLSWSGAVARTVSPADPERVLLSLRCLELLVQTGLFYAVLRLYTAVLLKKDAEYFRLRFQNLRLKWVVAGAVCPLLLVGIYLLFFHGTFERGTLGAAAGIALTLLHGGLKAGITEEVLFRGFLMKLFETRWNRAVAVALNSFLFAFIHLGNAGSISGAEMTMMLLSYTAAGITFSLVTYRENSVFSAVIMHALWNIIAESNILCIITSPRQYDANAVFNYRLEATHVLNGGFFGISASIFAVFAFLAPLVLFFFEKRRHGAR